MSYSYDRRANFSKMALAVGETFENDLWRVHRYRESIRITSLEGAGKRGKKCDEWVVITGVQMPSESISDEFVMHARRGANIQRMLQAIKEAEEIGAEVHHNALRGVDVKPGNFQKLVVRGIHITVEADYDAYSIRDIDDDMNEPTCIARGKRSIFQFYRWVKDNAKALQRMTMGEAMRAMDQVGIDYHYYCAVD